MYAKHSSSQATMCCSSSGLSDDTGRTAWSKAHYHETDKPETSCSSKKVRFDNLARVVLVPKRDELPRHELWWSAEDLHEFVEFTIKIKRCFGDVKGLHEGEEIFGRKTVPPIPCGHHFFLISDDLMFLPCSRQRFYESHSIGGT